MNNHRRGPHRLLIAVVAVAAVSLAATIPGLDLRSTQASTDDVPAARTVTAPEKGAYLGAFVNTAGTKKGGTFKVVLANLPAFVAQMGRNPAIVPAYQSWAKPWVRNENLTAVAELYGAIPMVSWHCGVPNEEIASGANDALIKEFAQQLKDYGRPVFLRWFWEANISVYPACLGPGPVAKQAAQYVAAYRRIARIFDQEGASNVAFVWSASTMTNAGMMSKFYPGDKYVDWIGADGYDRDKHGSAAFTEQFAPWYVRFVSRGKPMIITETGATTDQPEFLQGVAEAMPKHFPKIKGFLYFDSVGGPDWRLSSYGGVGIAAFAELGRNPYFATLPKLDPMTIPVGIRPLGVVIAVWLLAMAALARPMLRDYGDDQGDGMSLVLLPPPKLPRFRRTLTFALVFVTFIVLYHSIEGPWAADRLYRSTLQDTVGRIASSRPEIHDQLAGYTLGLRALMLAAMLSLALTCRATPLRRCSMLLQSIWYVTAVFLFDALLLVLSLVAGVGVAPGTILGNWFAIGIGFVAISRLLYANFALPKPTELSMRHRTGRRDTVALLAVTMVGMCVSVAVLVLTYRTIAPDQRPVLALIAPLPFSVLTYVARSALLGVAGLLFLRHPEVGDARPPIDVIIPAYNEEDVLLDTLQSIDAAAVRYRGPVRVILTDDGSTDRTRCIAEHAIDGFIGASGTIVDGEHKGKSAALNLALAVADADVVVRIDADTLIAEDALVHVPRWFRDPRIGLVEALMWPRGNTTLYHRMRLFEELRIFGLNHRVLQIVDAVNVVPGVFTAFRRAPAVQLGGFTVGMNGEDGDFTMRMGRLGWRTRLDPEIVVYEGVPETFAEMREQRVRWSRATIHNQARQGIYRAGVAPPMVWFTQTHQYFRRVRSPIFFVLPFYLAISAAFEPSWRTPVLVAITALLTAQVVFTLFTLVLALGYGFVRHLGWIVLWPLWRWSLTMFSTESLLSLPGRPLARRTRDRRVIVEAVVH